MPETWYPFAERKPGRLDKTNSRNGEIRLGKGAVLHSAEGYEATMMDTLLGPREASWHFTVLYDGRVWQHFPIEVMTWHAGRLGNPRYVGIEHEGIAGEPLSPQQLDADVSLLKWLASVDDWPAFELRNTLFEHNWLMATQCPSGRIPWPELLDRLSSPVPAAEPPPPPPPPPAPLVVGDEPVGAPDRAMKGLIAAAFVISIGHPLSDLSEEDRGAVRYVASLL